MVCFILAVQTATFHSINCSLFQTVAKQVGLFEHLDDKERVVLLISLLGRQVRATLPRLAVFAA